MSHDPVSMLVQAIANPGLSVNPVPSNLGSDAYPLGVSTFWLTGNQAIADGGWPTVNSAQVITVKTNSDRAFQLWARNSNSVTMMCYRQLSPVSAPPVVTQWATVVPDCGTFSGTTDASGYVTVPHGLNYTPSQVFIQMYPAGAYTTNSAIAPGIDTITATSFRVRAATAVSAGGGNWYLSWISNPIRFFWQAVR